MTYTIDVTHVEKLAVEHEAFGFGRVDHKGYTTHGFDPDGLQAFANALIDIAYDMVLRDAAKICTLEADGHWTRKEEVCAASLERCATRIRQLKFQRTPLQS